MRYLPCATLIVCAGCAPTLIPLGSAVPVTDTVPRAIPLEIVTRSSAADPLPLDGSRAKFGDLEVSLGHAVATAAVAWADAHRGERPDGWQLLVELAQARAERSSYGDGVITVTLNVRATLRARVGLTYLAQTQVHCKERGISTPERAAPLFYGCMMAVGRELAGWLGGIQP
jgi:hypothetical protein